MAHPEWQTPPYELVSLLGEGGASQVWRAASPNGVDVAVKVPWGSGGPYSLPRSERERILRNEADELRAWQRAPGAVRVIHDATRTTEPFLVLELLGESLDQRITRAAFSQDETRALLRQLLDLAAELHDLSCYHNDLKPENVLWRASANGWALIDPGVVGIDTVYFSADVPKGRICDLHAVGRIVLYALTRNRKQDSAVVLSVDLDSDTRSILKELLWSWESTLTAREALARLV